MSTGIYLIRNTSDGKFYVGSASNVEKRWSRHRWALERNRHANPHLQHAWNKHGGSSFVFETYSECAKQELKPTEQHFLDLFCGTEQCYNIAIDAECPTRGLAQSEEARQKKSEALRGRTLTEEHKQKIGQANKGTIHSETSRRNMALAHQGKILPKAQRRKIGRALRGESAPLAKLTENEVKEIRQQYGEQSYNQLARQFGVDKKSIINVVKRRTWKHIK